MSRLRGWEANDPVHERASAFSLASASSFIHSVSVIRPVRLCLIALSPLTDSF